MIHKRKSDGLKYFAKLQLQSNYQNILSILKRVTCIQKAKKITPTKEKSDKLIKV